MGQNTRAEAEILVSMKTSPLSRFKPSQDTVQVTDLPAGYMQCVCVCVCVCVCKDVFVLTVCACSSWSDCVCVCVWRLDFISLTGKDSTSLSLSLSLPLALPIFHTHTHSHTHTHTMASRPVMKLNPLTWGRNRDPYSNQLAGLSPAWAAHQISDRPSPFFLSFFLSLSLIFSFFGAKTLKKKKHTLHSHYGNPKWSGLRKLCVTVNFFFFFFFSV